jgi:toxin-antitoxin system PIN domain toxin
VILLDSNILVYAHLPAVPEHAKARRWLEDQFNGRTRVGLPWSSLLSFVRIASNPRIYTRAESVRAVWTRVEEWLDLEVVWIPLPTDRHRDVLGQLLRETSGGSNLVPDAHLAALALEHGLTLCSTDRDFARFPGLRWNNPLAAA